jgi:hypothetical protein
VPVESYRKAYHRTHIAQVSQEEAELQPGFYSNQFVVDFVGGVYTLLVSFRRFRFLFCGVEKQDPGDRRPAVAYRLERPVKRIVKGKDIKPNAQVLIKSY